MNKKIKNKYVLCNYSFSVSKVGLSNNKSNCFFNFSLFSIKSVFINASEDKAYHPFI